MRGRRFGVQLDAALRERNVTGKWLADRIGCGETAVSEARLGRVIPRMETARAMADALDWPALVTACLALRTKACEVCGVSFVDPKRNMMSVTCSTSCRWTRQKRKDRESRAVTLRSQAEIARNRLELYANLVDTFCRECSPEGVCIDAGCRLRPVSPLPVERRRLPTTKAA